eukprot:TRINITY_DN5553_c0_g1_i1.p1 TRINITY_DN5553_c0_g1~~TRINITY_DN5553_c0_g1_i1.p1  ORF type:complete len:245 (+),score=14.64 TRINITY_DN5553_c0_g1_i1:140-874(+)
MSTLLPEPAIVASTCPVCAQPIDPLDLQQHVNDCLDHRTESGEIEENHSSRDCDEPPGADGGCGSRRNSGMRGGGVVRFVYDSGREFHTGIKVPVEVKQKYKADERGVFKFSPSRMTQLLSVKRSAKFNDREKILYLKCGTARYTIPYAQISGFRLVVCEGMRGSEGKGGAQVTITFVNSRGVSRTLAITQPHNMRSAHKIGMGLHYFVFGRGPDRKQYRSPVSRPPPTKFYRSLQGSTTYPMF